MNSCYASAASKNFCPDPHDNIMDSIWKQYEGVIIESLITSFGLDFLVRDRHGGDVDTIHNVRQVGKDPLMAYKNKANQDAYDSRGSYDSHEYHSDKRYIAKNRQVSQLKKEGGLKDAYTGAQVARNEKTDLDHVISAKSIHDDPGRVLAGLKGTDLANSDENLQNTNPHSNRTKKALSMDEYLERYGEEYTEEQKANMLKMDEAARKAYEDKIATAYYTSPAFAKDVAHAAKDVGLKMGLRQVLGFVFAEIWFSVKEEFQKNGSPFQPDSLLKSIGNGVRRGFENAKAKYGQMLQKFKEGAVAGVLSSLTTTLCNIFFSTAKNVVKIIRQSYVSLVQAAKVLFINPDNLPFGERMRAIIKILSVGASVVAGGLISELISKTPLGTIPVLGEVVQTFCGTLVTGIMSCTLLYFFDRSEVMNRLVRPLDKLHSSSTELNYFRSQAVYFERFAAELMQIDIKKFTEESRMYCSLAVEIDKARDETQLNAMLKNALEVIGVKLPWDGTFDCFMEDKDSVLVFE